jgi:hypothetical protein
LKVQLLKTLTTVKTPFTPRSCQTQNPLHGAGVVVVVRITQWQGVMSVAQAEPAFEGGSHWQGPGAPNPQRMPQPPERKVHELEIGL